MEPQPKLAPWQLAWMELARTRTTPLLFDGRAAGKREMRSVLRTFWGVDWAKPGSDRTVAQRFDNPPASNVSS